MRRYRPRVDPNKTGDTSPPHSDKPSACKPGDKYNNLTVVSVHSRNRHGGLRWNCQCDCGRIVSVLSDHLKRGHTKSCGCARPRKMERKQWTGYGGISGQFWAQITRRRDGTKDRRELDVSITIEYAWDLFLEQGEKCALSGVKLHMGRWYSDRPTASLDRINSGLGYIIGNVQWVHKDINFMKRNLDQDYFVEMCKKVTENNIIPCDVDYVAS